MTGAPLRVGIVANTIDAEYGVRTGGTLHFVEVAKRMTEWEVRVFVPSFVVGEISALLPKASVVGMPSVHRITKRRLTLYAASLVSWIGRIRELRSCDVLYASSHFLGDTVPAIVVRGRRTLVVVHHIIDRPAARSGGRVGNAIAYVTERLSLALIRAGGGSLAFDNSVVAAECRKLGVRNRSVVSGNGIDVPPAAGNGRVAHDVAYVGRLSPMKAVDDLLRAWQLVVRDVRGAHLRIIGEGTASFRNSLVALRGELGLDGSVTFLGRAADDEKFAVLRASSVFAFASKEEGWGIAVAEAMACGLPAVTYDLPAYREIFTAGRVSVPVGDVAAFAREVVALLRDAERRDALGREAQLLATGFTWDKVARAEIELIRDLAGCS